MTKTSSNQKIHPLWRGLVAMIALLIGAYEFVGYKVARSINLNYFNTPHVPTSALHIAALLLALYLLAVALTGRWQLLRTGS